MSDFTIIILHIAGQAIINFRIVRLIWVYTQLYLQQ